MTDTSASDLTLEEKASLTSGADFWTTKSIERAGVPSIAVLSGGVSRGELLEAGASDVFEDPGDLLAKLGATQIDELAARLSASR